jgi:hypothetical protein
MKKITKKRRIHWLLQHQYLWDGNKDRGTSARQYLITGREMEKVGLLSRRKEGWIHDLAILITEARKQKRISELSIVG